MAHRQPALKDQVRLLRKALSERQLELSQGHAQELVARLNGYASWNVAKAASPQPVDEATTQIEYKVWVATYYHRHGHDLFFFPTCPSENDVIEVIKQSTGWEPDQGEYIEIGNPETFTIDVAAEMQKACMARLPNVVGVHEVCMTDLFEYDTPEELAEWRWVQSSASFGHLGNGKEPGVWEFMVHVESAASHDDIPATLVAHFQRARQLGAAWVMFHQG